MSYSPSDNQIQDAYRIARERYEQLGINTDAALDTLAQIPLSLHCWQGDDVGGLERRTRPRRRYRGDRQLSRQSAQC